MYEIPAYNPTPLMQQLNKKLFQHGHPNAFAIADFGEGPLLTYRKHRSRVSVLSVNLTSGERHIKFSNHSKPPYLIVLAQEKPNLPISAVIYRESPDAILEQDMESRITGQVLAYGQSPDGSNHTLVHALYLPECSRVYAAVARHNSLLLEGHPDLCSHLLTCGMMIDTVLRRNKEEAGHET